MWALGIHASAHYGNLVSRRPKAGALSTWQERLAKDVIEVSLVGGIGLAELANFCGLRTSQFAHAFKVSTGVAPYQWLAKRRIAQAKRMLVGTTSLVEIADASGFADQSHMTRIFSREVGTTPGKWRANLN
jgi:AraC-like DNA-binding protein